MDGPYFEVLHQYLIIKNKNFTCRPDLSIDNFRTTQFTGRSASGMSFGIGEVDGIPVFVKIFPMTCNTKTSIKGNNEIHRKKIEFDKNSLEIGIMKYMSDLLFKEIPFTQNLTAVYGIKTCPFAFETKISSCTRQPIPHQKNYLIPSNRPDLPQSNLISNYRLQNWDDQVNVLITEYCDGDLENLFNQTVKNYLNMEISEIKFNRIWNSIFMQLSLVFASLNIIMGHFHHNDAGARNFLFSVVEDDHTYFQYNIGPNTYFVENTGYIAKVWDLSYMFLNDEIISMLKASGNFSYLREEDVFESAISDPIPSMIQLCSQIIEMESFSSVENLEICKKIIEISQLKEDNFDLYVEKFETFVPTSEYVLLNPVFQLDVTKYIS